MPSWEQIKPSLRLDEMLEGLGLETQSRGHERWARCPLSSHPGDDRNPSFSINDLKLVYSCFTCGEGGSLPKLVEDMLGMTQPDALQWLSQYSQVPDMQDGEAFVKMIQGFLDKRAEKVERKVRLPWFSLRSVDFFTQTDTDWFSQRGISPEGRQQLKLGYDPTHRRADFTGPCVIIPHVFQGDLVGWQERWVEYKKGWYGPAKYTNTDDFPKRYTLYNYDRAMELALQGEPVHVVESAMSVAVLVSHNINAVATFGTSVTPEQIKLLRRFPFVTLVPDNDAAGIHGAQTLITALEGHMPLWVAVPPEGDIGDLRGDAILDVIDRAEPGFLWTPSA